MFAYILTVWSKRCRYIRTKTGSIAALYHDIMPAVTSITTFSIEDIKQEQRTYSKLEGATIDDAGVLRHKDTIWISNEAKNLKLRTIPRTTAPSVPDEL